MLPKKEVEVVSSLEMLHGIQGIYTRLNLINLSNFVFLPSWKITRINGSYPEVGKGGGHIYIIKCMCQVLRTQRIVQPQVMNSSGLFSLIFSATSDLHFSLLVSITESANK